MTQENDVPQNLVLPSVLFTCLDGKTDAASKSSSVSYGGLSSPYLPSALTHRNNQIT